MVSVATKIGMFTMLSTMALGRELTSTSPEQELGDALVGLLTDLREDIKEIQESRAKESAELDQLRTQMGMLESK